MLILATVHIEGDIVDTLSGTTEIDRTPATSLSGIISHLQLNLASGFNQFLIPSGARGVIITCDTSCDSNKSLQGSSSDSITNLQIFTELFAGRSSGTFLLLFGAGEIDFWIFSDKPAAPGVPDTGLTELFYF